MTGLPSKWDGVAAKSFFTPLGEVIDCVVFKDQSTGNAKYGQCRPARRGAMQIDCGCRQTGSMQTADGKSNLPHRCHVSSFRSRCVFER